MFASHKLKTIIAYQWERMMVSNFLSHCLTPDERNGWNVRFLGPGESLDDIVEAKNEK